MKHFVKRLGLYHGDLHSDPWKSDLSFTPAEALASEEGRTCKLPFRACSVTPVLFCPRALFLVDVTTVKYRTSPLGCQIEWRGCHAML